jgi:choline kinase
MAMKAIILAAGLGRRLGASTPKCLLEFGGRTLLQRHLDVLASRAIDEVVIGVGHGAEQVEAALAQGRQPIPIRLVYNPDYAQGSIVTLWHLRESLCAGSDALLMDADVLYDRRVLARLLESRHRNCFLLDREFEPGDEPVKLCVRDGRLVEFRKQVDVACDYTGESVGFFRLSGRMAGKLIEAAATYIGANRRDQPYEEALRDTLLAEPDQFSFEDITGLAWIEIDFPADIERARAAILPQML